MRTEDELEERPPNEWFLLRRSPGRLFHAAVALLSGALLWAYSGPRVDLTLWIPVVVLAGLAAVLWGARLITFLVASIRNRSAGSGLSWLIAPAFGLVVLVHIAGGIPLWARWTVSRPAFEAVVQQRQASGEEGPDVLGRLGLYQVDLLLESDGSLLFSDRGDVFDSGFAYLPDGPRTDLVVGSSRPLDFEPLGGPWYAWTAS